MNDLYTPEVTTALAQRLGATTVINRELDRNALDLNRVADVRRRAPWFGELLAAELERLLTIHACVEAVFVHGWNTGQLRCDIGIGAVEHDGGLHVPEGAFQTVAGTYVHGRITPLRSHCEAAGIGVSVGARYPASHPNNLLQIFSARGLRLTDAWARRIAEWAVAGRINAVQLELGAPLRWPGAWRDRFVAAVGDTFVGTGKSATEGVRQWPSNPVTPPRVAIRPASAPHPSLSLQLYDRDADVGIVAGVSRLGSATRAARLLLFLGGQQIGLFTGEGAASAGSVHPLRLRTVGESVELAFRGPVLVLDDARLYLDLEAALAASSLVEADLELRFLGSSKRHVAGINFGSIQGRLSLDGRSRDLAAWGFAGHGGVRSTGLGQQTMLAADLGGEEGILIRAGAMTPDVSALVFECAGARPLVIDRLAVTTEGDGTTPDLFEATSAEGPVRARPLCCMPILRPGGPQTYVRVTFGVTELTWGERRGFGLYEYAVPVPAVDTTRR
jgi:hypothetical protein